MISDTLTLISLLLPLAHWTLVIGLSLRVLSKRRPPGVSIGWLLVLVGIPFVGCGLYLFFGEPWLGAGRMKRARSAERPIERLMKRVERSAGADLHEVPEAVEQVARVGLATDAMPLVGGNDVGILDGADEVFPAMLRDIEGATRMLDLLYFIWQPRGRVLELEAALVRAAGRGVRCRVLVDATGGRAFFASSSPRTMREAGIEVAMALPVKWLRAHFSRIDLRNHRKLLIVDEEIAYTGSLNMADPKLFKVGAGVGEWVDVMARVRGPGVAALSAVFECDWMVETGRTNAEDIAIEPISGHEGDVELQVVPSGPHAHQQTIHRMLIQGVHEARKELVLTTPYFTPDEAMMAALVTAAQRGVDVTLIVPERVDSKLVALASSAYYQDLLDVGVRIRLYRGGLLHAKTVTIDGTIAMLGTVNMDRRSFGINFELSLFVYDRAVCKRLREVQARYMADSKSLTESGWERRPRGMRLLEHAVQLLSPLL